MIGLFKTEIIRRRGPWWPLEAAEYATLEWVDWFNHRRVPEPIGNMPSAEARYYAAQCTSPGRVTQTNQLPEKPGWFSPKSEDHFT
ncbi:hypothetical protein SKB0092_43220 (plasmid) [Roseomonas mucosa]